MRVLTLAESRQLDRHAIEELGIPGPVLMENAALGVVDALGERFPEARRVAVICGPGNNGGDGFAVARQLAARGYDVDVLAAVFAARPAADARLQRAILERSEVPVEELSPDALDGLEARLSRCDLVVDALFGVGLSRPLEGPWARLVEAIAGARRPVVAIDLPSGLDGDRPTPIGPVVRADLTVTFLAPKPALVLSPSAALAGEVVIADLGFPAQLEGGPGTLHLLLAEELAAELPRRAPAAHKGDFGHVLLIAGGPGMIGAAVLAARAAVVGGTGLVTVAAPVGCEVALAAACPEAMTLPLPADGSDPPAGAELVAMLCAAAAARTVVAVGPGLGRRPATSEWVRALVLEVERPLVLDADGLAAFAGRLDDLARRSATTVLTPHPGELGHLLGRSTAEIQADRLGAAREAARRSGAVVVLKGERTVVAAPDGEAWINPTGNAGMASGGAGDVLTGLVAARLAQGDEADFAACLSVHLHGSAGDLALERAGGPAVPASQLVAVLGAAWARLAEG